VSDGRRSFWSSIPGLITGLAGLLTGVVGVGTLAVQQGIIGGRDSATTTTTVVGAAPAGGPTTTATEEASFTVDATSLRFQATERSKRITVTNSSRTATITMLAPRFNGPDQTVFSVGPECSNTVLRPNATCTVTVQFAPSGLLKQYNAKLQFEAKSVPTVAEVAIQTAVL